MAKLADSHPTNDTPEHGGPLLGEKGARRRERAREGAPVAHARCERRETTSCCSLVAFLDVARGAVRYAAGSYGYHPFA